MDSAELQQSINPIKASWANKAKIFFDILYCSNCLYMNTHIHNFIFKNALDILDLMVVLLFFNTYYNVLAYQFYRFLQVYRLLGKCIPLFQEETVLIYLCIVRMMLTVE